MEIIKRKDALALGLKTYFTGKPCKWGHVSTRKITNKECSECSRIRNRQWLKDNPEKSRAKSNKLYVKHHEYIKARSLKYQKENPMVSVICQENRRAKLKEVGGRASRDEIDDIFEKQGYLCVYCRKDLKNANLKERHIDHIMPIFLGGSGDIGNLQILCAPCNHKKGRKHPDVFEKMIGYIRKRENE